MRWVPTVSKEKLSGPGDKDGLLRSVGLYKVQGDAVAAVIGAIYEQFVRSSFFSSKLLFILWLGWLCSAPGIPHSRPTKSAARRQEWWTTTSFPRRGA